MIQWRRGIIILVCGLAMSAPVQAQSEAYQKLKNNTRAVPVQTLAELRGQVAQLAGRTVELNGELLGFLMTSQGRTCMFRLAEGAIIRLVAPERMTGASALQAGARVRLLAEVSPEASAQDTPLTIRGVAPESEESENKPEVAPGPARVITPATPEAGGVVVLPPDSPGAALPAPRKAPAPGNGRALAIQPDQKSAFKMLVRGANRKLTAAQVDEIASALLSAGYTYNMDPRFIAAIIAVESDFDIYCLSSSGAMGLGQIMPFNLKEAGITNAWNPTQNIMGTARLLRGLLNNYAARQDGTLLAVAAYNAGSGAVRRAGYRVPSGAQVQRYVWKVYYRYRQLAPDMFP